MSRNPCESRHEKIAILAIGELDAQEAAELRRHLETCADCQALYDEMVEGEVLVRATFEKIAKAAKPPRLHHRQTGLAQPAAPAKSRPAVRRPKWTPLRILALAAAFTLAAGGLFSRLMMSSSFGATFADVLRQVQKAVSVQYTRTITVEGREPQVCRDLAVNGGRMRTVYEGGEYCVCDFVKGERLFIDPVRKVGRYTRVTRHSQDRLSNYLDWLSTLHNKDAKLLRQEELGGRRTNVFEVEQPFERFTIWADEQTNLPVRVERVLIPSKGFKIPAVSLSVDDFGPTGDGEGSPSTRPMHGTRYTIRPNAPGVRQERTTVVLTNFVWDAALDETLFHMSPPEGCDTGDVGTVDVGDAPVDQEALVAALRFWAELADGPFPADIDALPDIRSQLIRRFDKDGPTEQEFAQALKAAHMLLNGVSFLQKLKAADNWFYAGAGVRLGDKGKPLCWWKNDGAPTYRVVYGDLAVRDVTPSEVPRIVQR